MKNQMNPSDILFYNGIIEGNKLVHEMIHDLNWTGAVKAAGQMVTRMNKENEDLSTDSKTLGIRKSVAAFYLYSKNPITTADFEQTEDGK